MPLSRAKDLGLSADGDRVSRIHVPQLSTRGRHVVREATDEQKAEQTRQNGRGPHASRRAQQQLCNGHAGRCVGDRVDVRA